MTALAAGHRPCFECRRAEAKAFVAGRPLADFDVQLHAERTGEKPEVLLSAVPDGAMVEMAGAAFARRDNRLLRWSFGGYTAPETINPQSRVKLLTPPTITAILRNGYQPRWHRSAQQWDD